MLKAKKPLQSKSLLLAKVRKRKPPRKPEQKTAAQLIPLADEWFSRYIRIRDASFVDGQWVGTCITCPRRLVVINAEGKWNASAQHGHLIGRGTFSLRYDEENGNMQCAHCNAWLDKDEMISRYRGAVDDKYGIGTYKRLKAASRLPDALKRPTKPELLQIIADSKQQIAWYLKR